MEAREEVPDSTWTEIKDGLHRAWNGGDGTPPAGRRTKASEQGRTAWAEEWSVTVQDRGEAYSKTSLGGLKPEGRGLSVQSVRDNSH